MSALLVSLLFGVAIPFVVMAGLVPSLKAHAPKTANYRGVPVFNGLGIVWFVWLVGLYFVPIVTLIVALFVTNFLPFLPFRLPLAAPVWVSMLQEVFPLLAGTCVFGLLDDWASDKEAKGFKGHIEALLHGRITTGGLKFLGIGILALTSGLTVCFDYTPLSILWGLIAAAVMALSANLMNLLDLRPGRAAKAYCALIVPLFFTWLAFGITGLAPRTLDTLNLLALAIACIGPILATLRFDLGELGMLGDVGANTMGALLGFLTVSAIPRPLLVVLLALLLAANLLSERVSFSKVIEQTAWLRHLDELGRKKEQ